MHSAVAILLGTGLGIGFTSQGAEPELPPVKPKLTKSFATLRSATPADNRLFEAVKNSELSIAKAAISAGATPQNKRLPILEVDSTRDQNVEILKLLIKSGANPNQRNEQGWTPLTRAVGLNAQVNVGCAKYLLANGADPNYPGPQGNTPLHVAVRFGSAPAVKLLLASGAKVRMKTAPPKPQKRSTSDVEMMSPFETNHIMGSSMPIHEICILPNDEVLNLLLKAGAKIDDVDANGWTPLHAATSMGNLEMTKILVKKGANVNAKSKGGRTPLHNVTWAEFGDQQLASVEALLAAGADPQAKTKDGLTPAAFLRKRAEAMINRAALQGNEDRVQKVMDEANEVLKLLDPNGPPIKVPKL